MRAFLIGQKPDRDLGFTYDANPPFDGVVIGSLTLGQALVFANEQALNALAVKPSVLTDLTLPKGEEQITGMDAIGTVTQHHGSAAVDKVQKHAFRVEVWVIGGGAAGICTYGVG